MAATAVAPSAAVAAVPAATTVDSPIGVWWVAPVTGARETAPLPTLAVKFVEESDELRVRVISTNFLLDVGGGVNGVIFFILDGGVYGSGDRDDGVTSSLLDPGGYAAFNACGGDDVGCRDGST